MKIVKLGGSIINPKGRYDDKLISQLIEMVMRSKEKFIFVIGGGGLCRQVQTVSRPFLKKALPNSKAVDQAQDWLGIAVTKINAAYVLHRLKQKLGRQVYPEIILNPTKKINSPARIYLAGGWKPGCSTDKDMMLLAETFKTATVFKITNFTYARKINPQKLAQLTASKMKKALAETTEIKMMSWQELKKLVEGRWMPGLNTPFDPAAAAIGCKLRKKVTLYMGRKEEFFRMLQGKTFRGTVIKK